MPSITEPIVRFEAARAVLGHAAVLNPERVTALALNDRGQPVDIALLRSRLHVAWDDAATARQRVDPPIRPVTPDVAHGTGPDPDTGRTLVAEHTTCTGNTTLRLLALAEPESGWRYGDDRWVVELYRQAPMSWSDPMRVALWHLIDEWDSPEAFDAPPLTEAGMTGDELDEAMTDVSVWLLLQDVPGWAALQVRARMTDGCRGHRWQRREAVREILAELVALDERLDHDPAAQWSEEESIRREELVAGLWRRARREGWTVGYDIDDRPEAHPDRRHVAVVVLPTGVQVRAHRPAGVVPFEGERLPWDGQPRDVEGIRAWLARWRQPLVVGAAPCTA